MCILQVPDALKLFVAHPCSYILIDKILVLTACNWCLKEDFEGHWDTVITWLGCIDAVLSTLSTVHKSSHSKHNALAWSLCLSDLKEHRGNLVQECLVSTNCSWKSALLDHVNNVILEVTKMSEDTTTRSKMEARSLALNTFGLQDLVGMDAVQALFHRLASPNHA